VGFTPTSMRHRVNDELSRAVYQLALSHPPAAAETLKW
jgi:hypothetical protein